MINLWRRRPEPEEAAPDLGPMPSIFEQPPPPHAIRTVTRTPPPTPNPAPFTAAKPAPPGPSVPDRSAGVRPLNNVKPVFPDDMQEAGRSGNVTMSCDISASGTTSNCQVVNVVGGQSFARSALEYVRAARFSPAIHNGVAVPQARHVWNIAFQMAESDE